MHLGSPLLTEKKNQILLAPSSCDPISFLCCQTSRNSGLNPQPPILSTHTLLKVSNLVAPTSFHSGHNFERHQALYSQPSGLSSVLKLLDCLAYFDAINHFPLLQP